MPPEDLTRATLGLSAVAGGALWGCYHLGTTVLAGQPVHRKDVILAAMNVAAAMLMGALVAYFLGPVLTPLIPVDGLKDPHAVGFGVGAVAWELLPFIYRALRIVAAKKAEEVTK